MVMSGAQWIWKAQHWLYRIAAVGK